jgi:hypothetical protein
MSLGIDRLREVPNRLLVADRALFDLGLMLCDLDAHRRHFKYLPLFLPLGLRRLCVFFLNPSFEGGLLLLLLFLAT